MSLQLTVSKMGLRERAESKLLKPLKPLRLAATAPIFAYPGVY